MPDNMPIEGWPVNYQGKGVSLADVQADKLREGTDRHAIVVDPVRRILYEFYQAKRTPAGWQAAQASIFDLKTNKLRPDGWTSTDAAGLPIFPAIVRYDELERGMIAHAMRVTVSASRRAYVAPATHFASRLNDPNLPRMGERFGSAATFRGGFSPHAQAILKGLKKYGMFVADNGMDWAISVAPDPRIEPLHEEMRHTGLGVRGRHGPAVRIAFPPLTSTRPGRNCCRNNAWPGRNPWPGRPARERPT